ncbi:desampylase [Haladaptatus sp. DJG-WS-42]|uniref:desampylase n=1 Tax=Haladaptatus sp. DJG-WS-42 TaxID=3120516 RepID=UPI0030CD5262
MIQFTPESYDALVNHAKTGAPEEICGLLEGKREGGHAQVTTIHPISNVATHRETCYTLDPEQQLAAMDAIEERGAAVVGFYHSHPAGPQQPSATDEAQATWGGYSYVIVSLSGKPFVGSWEWTGEGFVQEIVSVGGN